MVVIIMGFPRVPPELMPIDRSRKSVPIVPSDPLYFYSRVIRRLIDGKVPIGFEEATSTFEAYSTPSQKEKYRSLVDDAREHAAYLKRNKGLRMSSYQCKIQGRLREFLRNVE